jgi:hypothetical protein
MFTADTVIISSFNHIDISLLKLKATKEITIILETTVVQLTKTLDNIFNQMSIWNKLTLTIGFDHIETNMS